MDTFYDKSAAKKSIERLAEYMAHHQLTLKEDYCIGPAHLIEDAKIAQRIAEAKAKKKTSQTDVDKDMTRGGWFLMIKTRWSELGRCSRSRTWSMPSAMTSDAWCLALIGSRGCVLFGPVHAAEAPTPKIGGGLERIVLKTVRNGYYSDARYCVEAEGNTTRLPVGPAQPHDGPKSNAIDIENGAGQDRGS
ncbi:hypothetical protein C8J57DRAFT_1237062 [Mycena rebaudengoi]|nr:hypothetical protein C8J57DRAFT_1237062 [Mycena rebaudengoi]